MVVVVLIFLSTAVIGGTAAVSPVGMLDSSSCGPAGELDSSSSSMTIGIDISPSSLRSGNRISSIYHAISSVVPLIDSNAFVHRHNIHTSAEDQSLCLEDRGTAGKMPRGIKKNHRS